MITFLTLQCNLIWNDVMRTAVLVPEHIPIPTSCGNSGPFIEGQHVDSSGKLGFHSGPLTCLMHVNQGKSQETTARNPAAGGGGGHHKVCFLMPCLCIHTPGAVGCRSVLLAGQDAKNESKVAFSASRDTFTLPLCPPPRPSLYC